jgi:hypothetical protein
MRQDLAVAGERHKRTVHRRFGGTETAGEHLGLGFASMAVDRELASAKRHDGRWVIGSRLDIGRKGFRKGLRKKGRIQLWLQAKTSDDEDE